MLLALSSKETVERLVVLVSGGVMKLLDVPKLPNWTVKAQAAFVFTAIEERNLTKRVYHLI